jgi:hypothetical protein
MQRLAQIRAAIQSKILQQYPEFTADAIEPYCRLICRRALAMAAKNAGAIDADPELTRENDLMRVTLTEEADALRDAIPEIIEDIKAHTRDDDLPVEHVAIHVMETFINGGLGIPPLSLEAIRTRVDTGSYLVSRWSGRAENLPARAYWEHRFMVWMLATEFDAPGMLDPYDPEQPERKAEFCEYLFPIEIAALRRLIDHTARRVIKRGASEERNMHRSMTAVDKLKRQFVGEQPEPPADCLNQS